MKYRLIQGDCLKVIPHLGLFNMIFADPPDNIDWGYNEYDDNRENYLEWLEECLHRFVSTAPIVWVSFNAKYTVQMGVIVSRLIESYGIEVKPCVQTFNFGQQRRDDLKNCHRPLWRFMRTGAPLYPDQSREPTKRMMIGDKRADPRGAVPADWFDFPRVTGNSRQRRDWHPTQLHEGILERCIKLCTKPGDKILDPFGGSGTTLRVAKRLNRACTLIEFDGSYCKELSKEHELEVEDGTQGFS
jgi:hypothetical protein